MKRGNQQMEAVGVEIKSRGEATSRMDGWMDGGDRMTGLY
jgi:hypothetical protein